MTDTILAVGAAGKFAGLVIPALKQRGARVRGLVRHADQGEAVKQRGAAEIAIGDLNDLRSIEEALAGVTSVFYIAPAFFPDEAAVGQRMVELAKESGVRRFVFSSVIHPVLSGLANHAAKAPVEEALLDSGMQYTILQPALYFQNYQSSWPSIVKNGVLAEPWSNDTRFSRVDYRDVAEVAAIALTEDRLLSGTFELCAEGAFNRTDVAALISKVLGQDIKAQKIEPAGLGPKAAPMLPMFEHYERMGLLGNALTLRSILGREPRTLQAYFEALAGDSEVSDG
jgi:uncharacterized protein YbjT (DUF2867 family)